MTYILQLNKIKLYFLAFPSSLLLDITVTVLTVDQHCQHRVLHNALEEDISTLVFHVP
jgi:hypothetical protein